MLGGGILAEVTEGKIIKYGKCYKKKIGKAKIRGT
jgi:hypothetical protein